MHPVVFHDVASDANGDDETTSENEIILQKFSARMSEPWIFLRRNSCLECNFPLETSAAEKAKIGGNFSPEQPPKQFLTNLEIGQFKKYHN